jgi:hypothetical protein
MEQRHYYHARPIKPCHMTLASNSAFQTNHPNSEETQSISIVHGILLWTNLINAVSVFIIFPHGPTAPSGPRRPHNRGFTFTLRHITHGMNPLDEWSARRWDLYLTTHATHKRQTSMLLAGFDPEIAASERRQTRILDGAATRISFCYYSLNRCRRIISIQC